MLCRTLAHHMTLAAAVAPRPQNFALDTGSIDGGEDSFLAAAAHSTTNEALSSPTAIWTTVFTPTASVLEPTEAVDSSFTAPVNCTTCLTTTTVVTALPSPTSTPADAFRDEDEDVLIDDVQGGIDIPFETAPLEHDSKWPSWFTVASFTLVFYDILTLGLLLWMWAFGYLWWLRLGGRARHNRMVARGYVEMARMDFGRVEVGRHERTVRYAREAELEREMVRLGMI